MHISKEVIVNLGEPPKKGVYFLFKLWYNIHYEYIYFR